MILVAEKSKTGHVLLQLMAEKRTEGGERVQKEQSEKEQPTLSITSPVL